VEKVGGDACVELILVIIHPRISRFNGKHDPFDLLASEFGHAISTPGYGKMNIWRESNLDQVLTVLLDAKI